MAAYFIDKDGNEFVRHINDTNFFTPEQVQSITNVQLDGHELDYVNLDMPGLPIHKNKRVVNFYGDHARFIAGNW